MLNLLGVYALAEGFDYLALRSFENVLVIDNKDADALNNISVLHFGKGNVEQAIKFVSNALQLDVDNEIYRQNLLEYTDTIASSDTNVDQQNTYEYKHVIALYNSGKFEELYKAKHVLSTSDERSASAAARACIYLDKYSDAIEIFKQKKFKDTNNPFVFSTYVKLLLSLGKTKQAYELLKRKRKQFLKDAHVTIVLAETLCILQKYDNAKKILKEIFEQGLETPEINHLFGLLEIQADRPESASDFLEKAHSTWPEHRGIWKLLYRIRFHLEKYDGCLMLTERLVRSYPQVERYVFTHALACHKLNLIDQAIEYYDRTLAISNNNEKALTNKGVLLEKAGKTIAALECFKTAVVLNPENKIACFNLYRLITSMPVVKNVNDMEIALVHLLNSSVTRPKLICKFIVEQLALNPEIKTVLDWHANFSLSQNLGTALTLLSSNKLILKLMTVCPVASLDFENLFRDMRAHITDKVFRGEGDQNCKFLNALAIQCLINEFIYSQSEQEQAQITSIKRKIDVASDGAQKISSSKILIVACYERINNRKWCATLENKSEISSVIEHHLDYYEEEIENRKNIKMFGSIENNISRSVQAQYEHNPYPRWVNVDIPLTPVSLSQLSADLKLDLINKEIELVTRPRILVAGCGTGQHSISVARRFKDCEVVAIDLSASSLSYAMRKSVQYGIKNIKYMQGDILQVGKLEEKFDIIESVGVLHHMDDPVEGWHNLYKILNSGGLMKIGLYSREARKNIAVVRRQIQELHANKPDDMLTFRQDLIKSGDTLSRSLAHSSDFYSTSNFRDLIFHVKEHTFTIPEIEKMLNQIGLHFSGFETSAVNLFMEQYPDHNALYSLTKWNDFEKSNPFFFSGMYQFWCQKK